MEIKGKESRGRLLMLYRSESNSVQGITMQGKCVSIGQLRGEKRRSRESLKAFLW